MYVSYEESKTFGKANLIVDHGIANILNQTVKSMCVLSLFEEMRKILLGRHRVHSLADLLQSPGKRRTSESALDVGECGLTVPAYLSSPPH